jgi:4-hydroxybenzoate polyprenyltransferase
MIRPGILLLLAGISAGIYAGVLNDLADLENDQRAGKTTDLMLLSDKARNCLVIMALLLCAAMLAILWPLTVSSLCFAAILLIHAAYNFKPLRLKERGLVGLFCIAAGEHFLPTLLALSLVAEVTTPVDPRLVLLLSALSLAFGLRGIIWHQLCDREADRQSGCTTFAAQHDAKLLLAAGRRIVFPIECLMLAGLLWLSQSVLTAWGLLVYGVYEWLQAKYIKSPTIIVEPIPTGRFVLFDFYRLFWPLTLLGSLQSASRGYWYLMAGFCLLFGKPLLDALAVLISLARWRLLPFCRSRLAPHDELLKYTVSDFEALYTKADTVQSSRD